MSKSLFGQLCAYLMSCDTHHRTCPRYLPKECSRQVSKKFEKYFSSYRADKHGHTDGQTDRQTDGQTDRRTDAGNDNTPPALGPRGKKQLYQIYIKPDPCLSCTIHTKKGTQNTGERGGLYQYKQKSQGDPMKKQVPKKG